MIRADWLRTQTYRLQRHIALKREWITEDDFPDVTFLTDDWNRDLAALFPEGV